MWPRRFSLPSTRMAPKRREKEGTLSMYPVDDMDQVVPVQEAPWPDPGAPLPSVLVDESRLVLSYWLPSSPPHDASSPMDCGFVRFDQVRIHLFGAPNDETLTGHALWGRGLGHYGVYQIKHSSLVRRLERMNAVHPRHTATAFDRLQHYIFTFHDSTFECVAEQLEAVSLRIHADERSQRMAQVFVAPNGW
jgi:hypothetical protein